MQKNPHLLIEGIIIAARAAGANRAFIFIRGEYELQADDPREGGRGGEGEGLRRRAHPRLGLLARARGAPRRGRLHLRRGVGAARLARGQARQPAPQAAVPREPGPLPGPDADQQRRDALQRAADRREGRGLVQVVRHREVGRHEARLGLGQRAAARATTRSSSASPRATSSTAWPAARPRAARSSAGSRAGRRRRCCCRRTSTCPTTSRTWPRPARCSAPARSSWSTTRCRSSSVALRLAEFYRHESCGKCTPCREGTNWTVKMLERIDRGEATPMDIEIMAQVQDEHHRQLPVRARRLDGDADRLDDREVPRRVRGAHRAPPRRSSRQQDYAAVRARSSAAVEEAGIA